MILKKAVAESRTYGNPTPLKTWLVRLRREGKWFKIMRQKAIAETTQFSWPSPMDFFHLKEKRILWPSSSNLRFSMPSKIFHTQLPVKHIGEADLFCTGTQREGLQRQKQSELLQEAPRWECSQCQFSIEFQPHCLLNFLYFSMRCC